MADTANCVYELFLNPEAWKAINEVFHTKQFIYPT